ncbi:TatD family hydrolase [Aquimarina sp. ERC-38]|uniref:TatD family hydrolase n=1 Tax=Aquimarina sp. ERC-38 TaxID=2949996 RepID=UPI0022466C60|nr:TatD family hydrolase [Aquimarina sp. ERC-38]UZO80578.1 TatD family hydrolase [Aquimarina sp. ERC-38]
MKDSLLFIDPHIHMTSRTTDDYEAMRDAGIVAIIEPSFWLGQPRTQVGSFQDYFSSLVGWEPFRASQFGIQHYCTIGLNSKEANNEALAEQVVDLLPLYLHKENVVAIGEIGYDDQTKAEDKYFRMQLEMAKELDMTVQVHTPHRDKKSGTIRSMEVCLEHGLDPSNVIIDHNNEETVQDVLDRGFWAAFTIYPKTKMGNERMVAVIKKYGSKQIIVNSSADWGVSDPLAVPKTASLMLKSGVDRQEIINSCYQNALDAFGKNGKMNPSAWLENKGVDQSQLFLDNSVLRGQKPKIDTDKIV